MNKNTYLNELREALQKNHVTDLEEILQEYEQHFAFKLADGFTQEEIAVKLGAPAAIAEQFESQAGAPRSGANLPAKIGLGVVAVFEALGFVLFFAWVLVLGAASLAACVLGGCLICQRNIAGLIPNIPYPAALVMGICCLALGALLFVAAYYCMAYGRQLVRASIRWHKNAAANRALPPLPLNPQFSNEVRRALRSTLLISVAVFGATLVLGYVISALLANSLEFWHAWNWFS